MPAPNQIQQPTVSPSLNPPERSLVYTLDECASRAALDITIKRKGGVYAFENIEHFAIGQHIDITTHEGGGSLKIHDIYNPGNSCHPLHLVVTVGRNVVSLQFLVQDPIGRAVLEDRFASETARLGQTEIKTIANRWGFQLLRESSPVVETSSDHSITFWGPAGQARGYSTSDLMCTEAGRLLLEGVFPNSITRHSISMPNLRYSITSGTVQRIERAALSDGPHEAWAHLLDLVEPAIPVDDNLGSELKIYDIFRPHGYLTPADLMVRFGP